MSWVIFASSINTLILLHLLSLVVGWGAFYRLKMGVLLLDTAVLASLILKIISSSVFNLFILGLYYYSGTMIPFWHEIVWGVIVIVGIVLSENCYLV